MLTVVAGLMLAQAALLPESLDAPTPPGFVVGHEQSNGAQSIKESVPKGESVQDWSRMVTVQHFSGLAAVGPRVILDRLGQLMTQACPGATLSAVGDAPNGNHAGGSLRVDCPSNSATVKPETMFARAIAGDTTLYLVQYAFRSVPDLAAVRDAENYLSAVRIR